MIISLTGKPCSGKGAVSELFCEKYNFKHLSGGEMAREVSKKLGLSIAEFNEDERIKKVDKVVDTNIIKFGKKHLKDDIVFDGRLAWHFIPKSFKVFLDVGWQTAGKRLFSANRENEKASSIEEAVSSLKKRWNAENVRYMELYGVNNLNKNNYDLIIKTDNKTPEQIAEKIYKEYKKFMQKA